MIELPDVNRLLEEMSKQLQSHCKQKGIKNPAMIGIHTGGVWTATRLHSTLNLPLPLGTLDTSFHRDDFTRKGLNPSTKTSKLPYAVEQQDIILVDDVLMSGRTIRAALDELFDYGRPRTVSLAVLLDLPGRELPIQADIIGERLDLLPGQRVKLAGPERLHLELIEEE